MKGKDIVIGQHYIMKVSGQLVVVRINGTGGRRCYGERWMRPGEYKTRQTWHGTNILTDREVMVLSATRVRQPATADEVAEMEQAAVNRKRSTRWEATR